MMRDCGYTGDGAVGVLVPGSGSLVTWKILRGMYGIG